MPLVAGSLVLLARVLRWPPRQSHSYVKRTEICLSSLFNDGEQTGERKYVGVAVPLDQSISRFRPKLVTTGRRQLLHRTARILSARNWCPHVAERLKEKWPNEFLDITRPDELIYDPLPTFLGSSLQHACPCRGPQKEVATRARREFLSILTLYSVQTTTDFGWVKVKW